MCIYINRLCAPPPPLTSWPVVPGGVGGGGLQQGRAAVDHVDPAPVLQVLGAALQRLDEVLVDVGANHPGLRREEHGRTHKVTKTKRKTRGHLLLHHGRTRDKYEKTRRANVMFGSLFQT